MRTATAEGRRRTVLRLPSAGTPTRLTLDRQGRRLAVGTPDGLSVLDLVDGGPPVRLTSTGGEHELVAWAPGGRGLLTRSRHRLRHCVLGAPDPCRTVATDAADDDGAPSWSPDGSSYVYGVERRVGGARVPDGVRAVIDGRGRTLEAFGRDDLVLGTPPVWTAAGPLWSTATLLVPESGGAVFFGRGVPGRFRQVSPGIRLRYRLRGRGPSGAVRTLRTRTVGDPARPALPVPVSDSPAGPVAVEVSGSATRTTYVFGHLDGRGRSRPIWSTSTEERFGDAVTAGDVVPAGVLADGRLVVAVSASSVERRADDRRLPVTELRVVETPGGPGRRIARGRSATVAAAYPSTFTVPG